MTRELARFDASRPLEVLEALRRALTADGPAVFVRTPRGGAAASGSSAASVVALPEAVHQRIALVVETSGSSGAPKRVALTADALLASAAASEAALGGAGRWILAVPVHYIAGLNVLVRSITAGFDPIVTSGPFDADTFVDAVDRAVALGGAERLFTSLVPVQLARLVDAARADGSGRLAETLRRLDRILVGGQSTPPALLDDAAALGLAVTRTYGASETSGGCVYDGEPIGATDLRIVDGEVRVAGPTLAEGYLDDPDRTGAAFVVDGGTRWYRTGDAGTLEGDILTVTGRLDRVIVSGGVKVSLDAVERVARGIRGIADAVAVPIASEEWGDAFVLVVEAEPGGVAEPGGGVEAGGSSGLEVVGGAVEHALGRPARPVAVVVADIPRLSSGKPDLVAVAAAVHASPGPPQPSE
ncbi:AMP-binding protein [Marisediminicola sp. LYQ134]|uniref:AMP-binding protein n=1 Tax=Marisediminicola sp. LYQ134 TaxID=3391061 RepID=UPI0039839CDE